MKKALILGGTGTMGAYLTAHLLENGYSVDAFTMDDVVSDNPNLRYIKKNAKDVAEVKEYLKNGYDAMIDFMHYATVEFKERYDLYLSSVGRYIALSSYRVYDDAGKPLTEDCSRLLETSLDEELKASDDYAIAKCRLEDILHASDKKNWTILRPTLVYGPPRINIVTLISNAIMHRALNGKKLLLPIETRYKTSTMIWGGDVAKLILRLIENPKCAGEIYTVGSSETHTWQEIADMYKEIIGLEVEWIPNDDFLNVVSGGNVSLPSKWILDYDRMFNRSVDNTKILKATGMKQSDLIPLYDGLKLVCGEVMKFAKEKYGDVDWLNEQMDKYIESHK